MTTIGFIGKIQKKSTPGMMHRNGYWTTLCPICKRFTRVGDGPEGLLSEHTMNYWSVWTQTPYIPCMVKNMTIAEARDLAAKLIHGFAPLGQEDENEVRLH